MKAFLLGLCLLSFSASAQKVRFTDTGNRWIYLLWTYDDNTQTVGVRADTVQWSGDTVYGGQLYRRGHALLFREDVSAGKLYFRFPQGLAGSPAYDAAEHLYFNYALQAGDTLQCNYPKTRRVLQVTARDSVLLGAVYHRRWQVLSKDSLGGDTRTCTIVEGLGCLEGMLLPVMPRPVEYYFGYQLTCFKTHGTQPTCTPATAVNWHITHVDYGYRWIDYFDNANSCVLKPAGVASVTRSCDGVTAFPNPAGQQVEFRLPSTVTRGQLAIYDLTGREIRSTPFAGADQVSFPAATVPAGWYLYRITTGSAGAAFTGRFEVQ